MTRRIRVRLRPKTNPCECGCGELAVNRFVSGHNTRLMTSEEQARRGTYSGESRRRTGVGYVKLHQVHEHRHVAEAKVGRKLTRHDIVHHKDGDKGNNHPDNLEVMTRAEHVREHRKQMMAARMLKLGW